MEEHFKPASAAGVDAVIHWKITGRPDGGIDHYEVVLATAPARRARRPSTSPASPWTWTGSTSCGW